MLKYITEGEYKKLLGQESIPDNFFKLVIEASNYINQQTFGRVKENDPPEEVKYVTCLIADLINEQDKKISEIDGNRFQTFRNGNWT